MGIPWYHPLRCLLSFHLLSTYVYFKIRNSIIFPVVCFSPQGNSIDKGWLSPTQSVWPCFQEFSYLDYTAFNCVVLVPLCEYGQANSGILPKWATKVHNEPFFFFCSFYHFITPTVSINQFPDAGVCRTWCIAVLRMQNCYTLLWDYIYAIRVLFHLTV